MKIMSSVWNAVWKPPVVLIALLAGAFGANQVGWSGADLALNGQLMGIFEDFIAGLYCAIGAAVCYGTFLLLQRIAKPALWLMVPVCLYSALVLGVWNGFASDFDAIRGEAIKHHAANAYAIEHMSKRGRYLSCNDERIQLTEEAQATCARALTVGPGERIPGSEHRCGFLGISSCFNTAPEKQKSEH
jgi:hypothetical protein